MNKTVVVLLIFSYVAATYAVPPHHGCWTYWQNVTDGYYILFNRSNQTYDIYVFTTAEYKKWSNGSNADAVIADRSPPGSFYAMYLPPGQLYYLVITKCPVNATLSARYERGLPSGVVSLGPLRTSAALAYFNIRKIKAYNPDAEKKFGVPNWGASLQLNVVLVARLSDGQFHYYWLQNVVGLETSEKKYGIWDNVWNNTARYSKLANSTARGTDGYVLRGKANDTFYASFYSLKPYSLPLAGYLLINVTRVNPLTVEFCYSLGVEFPKKYECYDRVVLYTEKPVVEAYIAAMPYNITRRGTPLSADLVFGGYGNDAYTTFLELDADLAVFYKSGDLWTPFSNLYWATYSTTESVLNLTSAVTEAGFISVGTGPFKTGSAYLGRVALPRIALPFINYSNPASGERYFGFATSSLSIQPPVKLHRGDTMYVLRGLYVNGKFSNQTRISIRPTGRFEKYDIYPAYDVYHRVVVFSSYPVNITRRGEAVRAARFEEWLLNGTLLSVTIPRAVDFGNNTRLVYRGTNITVAVDRPYVLQVNFDLQYRVRITFPKPLSAVDAWVDRGSTFKVVILREYVLNNGTKLMYRGQNLTFVVDRPVVGEVGVENFAVYYDVAVRSKYPAYVTVGRLTYRTTSWRGWVERGAVVEVQVPAVQLIAPGVRAVYRGRNLTIGVLGPSRVDVDNFTLQYLVRVESPVPVKITAGAARAESTRYEGWVDEGAQIAVEVPPAYELPNRTMLLYVGQNYTLKVTSPLSLSIQPDLFKPMYLVEVASPYPVLINGTPAQNYSRWLPPGAVLKISSELRFINGVFMRGEDAVVEVSGPLKVEVRWSVEPLPTAALYLAVAAAAALALKKLTSKKPPSL